jgi:NADPH-dependent ferric siderophore reductase
VYDKGVEAKSHPPGEVWRAEVEAKQRLAPALWRSRLGTQDPEQWAYDTCAVQWRLAGFLWPLPKYSPEASRVVSDPKPPTDAERTAEWLRSSVRPAVERLKRVYTVTQLRQMLSLEDESPVADGTDHAAE